jgi:flagellar biosynthesis GTPase FlhF
MAATISKSVQASQRRERFREYMRKLNPTAPARLAIDSGLVVEDLHGSLYKTLAARADLDPGSQQLLVGGTGSGKTTELLLAERWLEQQGQTLSLYSDISSETDLTSLNSGHC